MKTIIAYCTSHGCTEKTAIELKDYLKTDVELCNLKKDPVPSLKDFERVVIGGSIHAGKIQKRITDFCKAHEDELIEKELGLFICCMEEGETAQKELLDAFPEKLHQFAKVSAYFGGEFDFNKMNFFEKLIIKKVAHVQESVSKIDHAAIKKFSVKLDKVFNPFLFLA